MAGAGAASAATIEEVPFADINSYESDIYEGWHQEHPAGDDSIAWSDEPAGVQLGASGPAQLINGLGAAGFDGVETPVTALVSLIQGASVEVEEGVVSFQVGLFQGADRNNWTTLRPVDADADLSSPDTLWRGTGSWHDDNFTLDELTEFFDVETVYLAGFGVHADNEAVVRSEEHTSELQSRGHLVCRLLLEKKKTRKKGGEDTRLICRPEISPRKPEERERLADQRSPAGADDALKAGAHESAAAGTGGYRAD